MTLGSVFDEARLRSVAVFGVRLTGTDGAVLADYPDVSLDGSRLEAFLRDVRAANVPDYQVADLLQDFVGA
jgi:hypothetical protein